MPKFLFASLLVAILSGCSNPNVYDDLKITTNSPPETHELAIAFGGGGVRGFMHLGVVKALEEEGIKADIVTGASAGSIAAVLYASGLSYSELETLVDEVDPSDIADLVISSEGVINGKDLADWINEHTQYDDLSVMPIKVAVTATDLNHQQTITITEGDPGHAVQTSSSIPGIFVPVQHGEDILVDGGMLSSVPVYAAKQLGAKKVIAVDIFCHNQPQPEMTMGKVMLSTLRMLSCQLSEDEINSADVLIAPDFEPDKDTAFDSKEEAIQAGYLAAKKVMPQIKALIAR